MPGAHQESSITDPTLVGRVSPPLDAVAAAQRCQNVELETPCGLVDYDMFDTRTAPPHVSRFRVIVAAPGESGRYADTHIPEGMKRGSQRVKNQTQAMSKIDDCRGCHSRADALNKKKSLLGSTEPPKSWLAVSPVLCQSRSATESPALPVAILCGRNACVTGHHNPKKPIR
jgi:hypothetical protein